MAVGTNKGIELCDAVSAEVRQIHNPGPAVRAFAFSPDSRYLAVGTGMWQKQHEPSEAFLFEAASGRELARLAGHGGIVHHLRFSPDGKTLATVSTDKTVRLWEVPSGKPRTTLPDCGGPTRGTEFLLDGTLVTARLDNTLRFWDVADGREVKVWRMGETLGSLAVSPDGTLLAGVDASWAAKGPSLLRLWDLATGKVRLTLQGHEGRVTALAFTPDGRGLVATANVDKRGAIDYWDLPSGQHRAHHLLPSPTERVAVSPDGKRVASSSWGSLKLWDCDLLYQERTFSAHTNIAGCGLFADGGKLLVTGSWDTTINVWDVARGERRGALKGHTATVRALALAPDGKTLYSASEDKTVKCWDLAMLTEKATLRGHSLAAYSLAVSPDGKTLASGGGYNQMTGPGEVILWDLETGQPRRRLDGVENTMWSLAFSRDGTLLAGGNSKDVVKVWDSATGAERMRLPLAHARPVVFSPDGKLLAAGYGWGTTGKPGGGGVVLWDTATWKERATYQDFKLVTFSAAFSPDGRTLAAANGDGTVKLWSVRVGQSLAPAPPPEIAIAGTAPRPQGTVAPAPAAVPVGTSDVEVTPPESPGWKILLALGVVFLLGGGLAAGLWLHVRRGRRGAAPVPAEAAVDAPPVVVAVCDGCGKRLKARAALAGKKVKCPGCGQAVRVPETGVSASEPDA
jgi:WD40 repeat protein